jgi:hypothetical protein
MIRWINFQRNTSLGGSNGGAGTFQMAVPLSALQGQPILQAFPTTSPEGNALIGLVFRYTIFRGLQEISVYKYPNNDDWMNKMMALYATKGLNPHNSELQGTVAPWYEGEPASCPVGRVLYASPNALPLCNPFYKPGHSNGTGFFLCVAMINVNSTANTVSIDLSEALPEHYEGNYDPFVTGNNPKWDIGNLTLYIRANGTDTAIGTLPYGPTETYDSQGWIYDFTYDRSLASAITDGLFVIKSDTNGELMLENQYFIVSDQSGVYAEMGPTTTTVSQFRNEGADLVPISFNVYDRGQLVSGSDGTLDLYWYDTTPNQDSGNMPANLLTQNYVPGTPISFPVSFAGNVLITAVLAGSAKPDVYGNFNNVAQPMITIRILPYNDYSQYYVNPSDPQPVGNASLTFDVIYQEVFQVYYLLFPAMSERIALNDPQEWSDAEMAGRLMQRISLQFWGTALQMPRTKDLSQCRRTLLTAWCLKYFPNT